MNISLTPELAKFVESEIQSGLYQTADEVVLAALRRLMEDQITRPKKPKTLEELEFRLIEGIECFDRGEGIDGEEVFKELFLRIEKSRARA